MTTYPPDDFARPPRPDPHSPEGEQDIDVGVLWNGVRRQGLWIVLTAALLGVATFVWSWSRPDVFEASSSLVTTSGALGGTVRDNVIAAPPLPTGALQEALQGPVIMNQIIRRVEADTILSAPVRSQLSTELRSELQKRDVRTLELQTRLDPSGSGIYTATARASTALASSRLADIMAESLLDWDRGRALSGVQRAGRSLRLQLAEVERQLAQPDLDSLDQQTLLSSRAALQRNLAQVSIQSEGATGSLELVAPAVMPLERVSPTPVRNAALVGVLVLLLGVGIAALRTVFDRTARREDDLLSFGLPTLGVIPRLKKRDVVFNGIVHAARQSGSYEGIGFLRVNVLSRIGSRRGQRLLVASTAAGEGRSSVIAALADGLAASGQRVLIVDADLRRGTQHDVWAKYNRDHEWRQLIGSGGARTLQEVFTTPDHVQVMSVEPNVDVLPAGPALHDSLGLLNRVPLGEHLTSWGHAYDVVLIDSPPLLALADGLVLGRQVDHMLLVVEEGKTSLQAIRRCLRRAETAGVQTLGFILNKVSPDGEDGRHHVYRHELKGIS